jgi:hypothetical protein
VADLKAGLEAANQAIAAMQEERKAFEVLATNIHESATQGREHAHDHLLAAQEHLQGLQAAQVAHQQALEQGAQAAALAPPPSDNGAGA